MAKLLQLVAGASALGVVAAASAATPHVLFVLADGGSTAILLCFVVLPAALY
jgi:hypothetical protein